ncbi:MAG: hypothetical protein ACM3XM_16615 [Mycobacterium leprae]
MSAWMPVVAAAVGAAVKGLFDLYMTGASHKRSARRRRKKRPLRQE